jgi:hypothetical protein
MDGLMQVDGKQCCLIKCHPSECSVLKCIKVLEIVQKGKK